MRSLILRAAFAIYFLMTGILSGQSITVNRYTTAKIDDTTAQTNLKDGSAALRIEGTQTKCGLALTQNPPVTIFPIGSGSITTKVEFDAVCATPSYIHVVNSITLCGATVAAPNVTIIGCSTTPGACETVVRLDDPDREESLWMHEYGHTKGLGHRVGSKLLMSKNIGQDQFDVSQAECNTMKGVSQAQTAAGTGQPHRMTIEEFVRRQYPEGISFVEAREYGPLDVPALLRMLRDDKEKSSWPNIVFMLGVIGDASAVEQLTAFLEKPVDQSSFAVYRAKFGVPLSLGYILNLHHAKSALIYLEAGSDPGRWISAGIRLSAETTINDSGLELARASVLGLGASGDPEALKFLQKLSTEVRAPQLAPLTQAIQHSIEVNQRVSQKGLE